MSPIGVGTSRSNPSKQTNTPKLWLLLVGVNKYQDEQIPSLQYSAVDCQGLAEALIDASAGQFTQQEVKIYHDYAPNLPLLETVAASLKEITTAAKQFDTILFYFSGHGIIEPNTQRAFLCLADTQKERLENTGLLLQDLLQSLSHCAAQNQLVWLDACHSGGMTLRGTAVEPLLNPTPQLVQILQQRAAISKGFYALLSCDTNQLSWEFPELGHGVFTYYLIRGLRGDAADTSNVISADSIYRYVYHQTLQYIDKKNQQLRLINQQKNNKGETQLTREYSLQSPKRIVEGVGELILGRRLDKIASSVHRRVGLVIEGLSASKTTLDISKLLSSTGGFEVEYLPAIKATAQEVRTAVTRYLNYPDLETILLYLRGRIEDTEAWEGLILTENIRIKRSWLKQQLRHSNAKQIIILDSFVETQFIPSSQNNSFEIGTLVPTENPQSHFAFLQDWVEDLQIDSQQGQCIISCVSTASQPEKFAQTLLEILSNASQSSGLSAAYAIAQLQLSFAGSNIPLYVSLSGSQGIIEILPSLADLSGLEQSQGLDLHVCPYMGLNAFSESDAQYYYGRESLTQDLIHSLQNSSFLAVVGASGSGKSSVVQAGLIPLLRQGKQIPNSEQWLVKTIRPGANPIDALAQKLGVRGHGGHGGHGGQGSNISPSSPSSPSSPLSPPSPPSPSSVLLEGILHQGVEGFVYWLRSQPHPMIVLVVDQFEELFTLMSDVDREKFLELLLGAVEYASDRFKLIITLRADFIAACLKIPALTSYLQESSLLVSPRLSLDDYRQVITKPAHQIGLKVEPELVEVLLRELDNSVGDLPLLEFVLEQLWQHRIGGELTLQAYQQQLGGIQGALERSSQALYESLEPKLQDCAKWIFLALTQLGEGTEDTRRRVFKSELIVKKYPVELVDRTLQVLTNAKLIVVNLEETEAVKEATSKGIDQNSKNNQFTPPDSPITVEVAHEILIRHWSTLRWWLEENRERLRKQRQIDQATRLWMEGGESTEFLLQGARLAEVNEIFVKYTDELSSDVQRFIVACLDERQRQEREQKRRLRQTQAALAVISILGVTATGFGGFAFLQRQAAQLREISALNASSSALLGSHQQIEALIAAIKAGRQLKQVFYPGDEIRLETIGTLQQAVFKNYEVNRLLGNTDKVNAVAVSFDGSLIASGSDDGNIKIWGRKGNLLASFLGNNERVLTIAFSNDGRFLLVGGGDKLLRIFSLGRKNGKNFLATKEEKRFIGYSDFVLTVVFSNDGKLIISGSRDKSIKVWDVEGKLIKSWNAHGGWVNSVAVSHDGRLIVSGGEDGLVKAWQVNDAKLVSSFQGDKIRITHITLSADGKMIAAAGSNGIVKLWSFAGKELQSFDVGGKQVNSLGFSADGKMLVTGGSDGNINVLSMNGNVLANMQGHQGQVNDVTFSHDGKTIVSGSDDKTVRIWDVPQLAEQQNNSIYTVSFNPTGEKFASAGWDKKVSLWSFDNTEKIKFLKTFGIHKNIIYNLKYSSNGKIIATASADKTIKLWDSQTGKLLQTLKGHQDKVINISFSPDNQTIVSGSSDKTIKLWRVSDGKLLKTFTGHKDEVISVAFSPDSKIIASGGNANDKTIKLWHSNGILIKTLTGSGNAIASLAFSPDSKTLASGSWDNTIKLWHIPDGNLINTFTEHNDGVTSLSFTPDGKILASASADGTIKLWNITNTSLIKTLSGHPGQINSISFSPDGKTLVSGGEIGGVMLWNLDLDKLIQQGCQKIHNYIENSLAHRKSNAATFQNQDDSFCNY